MSRKVVIISDLHCGGNTGLTHPDFEHRPSDRSPLRAYYKTRRACWKWFEGTIRLIGKVDVLVINGDAIDGKNDKTGGLDLITSDPSEQVNMVCAIVEVVRPKHVLMTRGTDYHTGKITSFENMIADRYDNTTIDDSLSVAISGVVFDVKHEVGRSDSEQSQHTAVASEALQNILLAERSLVPKADIIIRSHVHYFKYCGGADWVAMTTPALQWSSSFGRKRKRTGHTDFGFVAFDIVGKGDFTWDVYLLRSKELAQKPILLP